MLSHTLNTDLTLQSTWLQAILTVLAGGIVIRRVVQLAPSAYLASAAGCSDLIRQMLPSYLLTTPDPNIESALSIWKQEHTSPPPLSSHQRVWDAPKIEAIFNLIFERASNRQTSAHLRAVTTSESRAWLNVLPIFHWV